MNRILITGGAGFIGSAVARHIINSTDDCICVVDKLTYAGNPENLAPISSSCRFRFEKADICDKSAMDKIFSDFCPTHVMHLAAEAGLRLCHVDMTVIAQKPKLAPHAEAIRRNVARLLDLPMEHVAFKATTEEKLGFTGELKGLNAVALVTALR